jgi:hypothetical protein
VVDVVELVVLLVDDVVELLDDVVEGGPDDTMSVTTEFSSTCVPPGGSVRITTPASTVVDDSCRWFTRRPAALSSLVASATVRPATDGTVTFGLPDDTKISTADPRSTCVPAGGFCRIT